MSILSRTAKARSATKPVVSGIATCTSRRLAQRNLSWTPVSGAQNRDEKVRDTSSGETWLLSTGHNVEHIPTYLLCQTQAPSPKTSDSDDSGATREHGPGQSAAGNEKTQAELDEELRRCMEGLAGQGGESGVELEDGKPVGLKRGVRENMFRYI